MDMSSLTVQLLAAVILSAVPSHCIHGSSACPSLNTEISELTAVETVIFSFVTDATNVILAPSSGAPEGFLELRSPAPETYHVVLVRGVNLNVLNPRPPPILDTNEQLRCPLTTSSSRVYQPLISALQYTLKCTVTFSYTTVQVQSGVRVAIRDVNNNAPYFLCAPYYKTVNELTPVSTTIFTLKGLAADDDLYGGISGYGLVSDGSGAFGLSGASSQGYIVVDDILDYDNGPRQYSLNISVTDIGDPPLTNWTLLYITIEDGDDQNPVFEHNMYSLTIEEQREDLIGTYVLTSPPIYAYDQDFGINATIGYKLITGQTGSEAEYFSINESSGAILILQKFDVLINKQFVLQVKAYQVNAEFNRFTFATLIIDIEDTNNHKPVLDQSSYNVVLPENPPAGYTLIDIEASDLDQGENAQLSYYVIDPGGALTIDPLSGSLSVLDPFLLDREQNEVYTVEVYAEEKSTKERYRSEMATVTLTLTDVNDNAPIFDVSHYQFLVNDIQPVGSFVGKVSASDADTGPNAELRYHIVYASPGVETMFSLDSVTGMIVVRSNLTSDPARPFYTIYIRAEDQPVDKSQTRSGYTTVDVSVVSVFNKPPVLDSTEYVLDVSEALLPGSVILEIQASDPDDDSILYSIDGDPEIFSHFQIGALSGRVHTVDILDRETRNNYIFWVNVTDKTYTLRCLVNVTVADVNDNHPVFHPDNMTFMLTEELPAGTQIGQIKVTDADDGKNGKVFLKLLGSWATHYVHVDGDTGVLSTTVPLDREEVPWIQFMVIASDQGVPTLSSVAMVTVYLKDINDNAPQIADDEATIVLPEASIPGFIYQVEAVDPDEGTNSVIRYTFLQNDYTLFGINPFTGEIRSLVSLDLEQDHTQEHHLVIMAYNIQPYDANLENDSFSLFIRIEDKNDKIPAFTQAGYQYTVKEDTPIWTPIGRVVARDADYSAVNRQIRYWLDFSGPEEDEMFMIEEFTGVIRLLKQLDTDRPDGVGNYTLKVYASDVVPLWSKDVQYNVSVLVNITVQDVNDNPPKFAQDLYQLTIPETLATGSSVISLEAYDPDLESNGHLNFDIMAADIPFIMVDNVLTLHGGLDADRGPDHYRVIVIVRDDGRPMLTGSTTIDISILNVNDHVPEFNQSSYQYYIPEGLPVGTTVGIVSATDGDFDILQYEVSEQYQDVFTINSRGELRTNRVLNYEEVTTYTFVVMAMELTMRDGTKFIDPHQTSVEVVVMVIDVNDNPPVFSQENYYVTMEENLSNQFLLQVAATDADSGENAVITYELLEGENSDFFKVDPETGVLEVLSGSQLDYSIQNSFILNVIARDGGVPSMSSLAIVTIEMIDVNNNPPEFSQPLYETSIEENHLAEYSVYQVTATDRDISDELFYQLEFPQNVPFYVNAQNGIIITTDSLDAELRDLYLLNVSVTDGLHTSYTQVKVTVIDVNDNRPQFSSKEITRDVGVDVAIGDFILQARATDPDQGMNGFVTHWLIGGEGKFHLDPFSGVMTLSGSLLASDVKDTYHLTIYARDHGAVPFVSNMSVILHVSKNNLHAPEFLDFVYDLSISEDMTTTEPLLKINVTDQDQGVAGQVTLTLSESSQHPFWIDPDGRLYLQGRLDYEKQQYYSLEVVATDGASDARSSSNTIRISVLDVNDNNPYFLPSPSHIVLPLKDGSSQLVTQVVAKDRDSSANGNNLIGYQLLAGFQACMLDPTSGELYTRPNILPGTYTVRIQAYDSGSPSLTNTTVITLEILNQSLASEYPVFTQQTYHFSYNESWHPPRPVGPVEADFSDQSKDYALRYAIVAGNDGEEFAISPYTGMIQALKLLDREQTDIYCLIITATRVDNDNYKSHALVIITVEDSNDEVPHFPFLVYTATVSESAPTGTAFLTLSALDPDISGELEYYLLSYLEDYEDYFYLSKHQGQATIAIAQPVDRETMPDNINLFVGASDGPNAGSPALVEVKILDVSDNKPRFEVNQYNFTVYENLGLCAEIGQVHASDDDSVDFGKLIYSPVHELPTELYLDHETGVLSVNCTGPGLDREKKDIYQIQIEVQDSVLMKDSCNVWIEVLDVNDHAPAFIEEPYVFVITEGAQSMDLLMAILVVDVDAGNNAQMTFTLEQNFKNYFNIKNIEQSGEQVLKVFVEVLKPLDREAPGLPMVNDTAMVNYRLKAVDHGQPALTSSVLVTVYIEDENDNPPVFVKPLYEVTISEGTPVMTSILTVTATDPDIHNDNDLSYSLHGADGILSIDPESGQINVAGQLDIAGTPELSLTVSVSDGKYSNSANLRVTILDTNNHIPIFSQDVYYFSVYENDHLTPDMNGRKGAVLSNATDSSVGQVIGSVTAVDRDLGQNGAVTYNVTSRNARGLFVIPNPAEGKVTLIGIVDREQTSHYTLIVTATDNGEPRHMSTCEVEIEILDLNDNVPKFEFTSYIGHVNEQSPKGITVRMYPDIRVTDRDTGINAEVQFQLKGPGSELFSIDPQYGIISVSDVGGTVLDRESKDKYYLEILASDRNGMPLGLTGTAALTIVIDDINDNVPMFEKSQYNISVSEASSPGIVIGAFVAHDLDLSPNNRLQYFIIDGADGKFWMDRVTGELYITGGLDREQQSTYQLNISTTDTGVYPHPLESFAIVNVILEDYNDNQPVFHAENHITLSVLEELPPPVLVGTVPVTDADAGMNGEVICDIISSVPFVINSTTGEVFTTESLDREGSSEYTFKVLARDRGYPMLESEMSITVKVTDVNDHSPEFDQPHYWASILERSPIGTVVILPMVLDPDEGENGNVSFSLQSADGADQFFTMDAHTGLVQVAKTIGVTQLMRQSIVGPETVSHPVINLTLLAHDNGQPPKQGQALLSIYVESLQNEAILTFDNYTYSAVIQEGLGPGTPVLSIPVTSPNPAGRISYSVIGTKYFTVGEMSQGQLVTTTNTLDYEKQQKIIFTVRALNEDISQNVAFAMVSVEVLDVNDNAPVFQQSEYVFTVKEGILSKPVVIGKVKATDPDSGNNGRVQYTILGDHSQGDPFDIDPESGEIILMDSLDREQNTEYFFFIEAQDHGVPVQSSTVSVTVEVMDINDNAPILDYSLYEVNVSNRASPGDTLLEFEATDEDEGLSGTVFFELDYDRMHPLPFYVNNKAGKGQLKMSSLLVYETEKVFDLKLIAYDLGTPRLSSSATIKVTVKNDLDLLPSFDRDMYEIVLPSESRPNTTVFVCSAGIGEFQYSIIAGNDAGYFTINPEACVVSLLATLPHRSSVYTLMLFVRDAGIPPNTDMARLLITVEPGPRLPVFTKPVIEVTVPENEPAPVLVVDLDTLEEMSGLEVMYYWMDNIYSGKFDLDQHTGKVWTAAMLDRENLETYTLVIRCNLATEINRFKRSSAVPSNIVEIIIKVGDVNDNPPVFEADLFVFGIPEETSYNSLVATVQATDMDTGNNSALVYSIRNAGDADKFRIDTGLGDIYSKVKVMDIEQDVFAIEVIATDEWGHGMETTATVMFQVLNDFNRVILVARVPPSVFRQYLNLIISNLSNILDLDLRSERIEPHLSSNDGALTVDESRTDLYFYAVDQSTGQVIPRDEVLKRIDEHTDEIAALFDMYDIEAIGPVMSTAAGSTTIGPTEGALITLGALVILGTLIGVICICLTWNSKKQNKTRNGIVPAYNGSIRAHNGTLPRRNGAPTVTSHSVLSSYGFHGPPDGVFRDPLDIDNVLIHDSTFKPMETQRLSIYLPDEGQGSDVSTESSSYSPALDDRPSSHHPSVSHVVPSRPQNGHVDNRVESIRDRRDRVVGERAFNYQRSNACAGYSFNGHKPVTEACIGATIIKEYYFADTPASISFQQSSAEKSKNIPSSILKVKQLPAQSDYPTMPHPNQTDGQVDAQRVEFSERSLLLPNLSGYRNEENSLVSLLDTITEDSEGQTETSSGLSSSMSLKPEKKQPGVVSESKHSPPKPLIPASLPLSPAQAYLQSRLNNDGEDETLRNLPNINHYIIGTRSLPRLQHNKQASHMTAASPCFDRDFFSGLDSQASEERNFTTFGKNLSARDIPPNTIQSVPSISTKKSFRFGRVSPLISPIMKCVEGEDNGEGSSFVQNKDILSVAGYENYEPRLKKRTWPGCGKVVTFYDCLLSQGDQNRLDNDKYVKFDKPLPKKDKKYEEAETKF